MSTKALVVIDVQREYVTPGRPFHIASIGPSLDNAKAVLAHARSAGWKVVHVRHKTSSPVFNHDTEFADFVDGFRPAAGETSVVKGDYSCFSAPEFAELMQTSKASEIVVIGYGATMCVLSTVIEGHHRGNQMTLVADATAARAAGDKSEAALHEHAVEMMKTFAKVVTTKDLVKE